MFDKLIENVANVILDEAKEKLDSMDFLALADSVLDKLEGTFKEGGLADNVIESVTYRIRLRYGIEDSNPDN